MSRWFTRRRWLARGVALTAACVLALLLGELLLRRLRPELADTRPLAQQLAESEQNAPPPGATVSLKGLVRASANPRLIYELKPGLDVTFQAAHVRTSPQGFRGPAWQRSKPPGRFRILGLGDSVLFGWAVREDQAFLGRLGNDLDSSAPGRFEVMNLGVPGYNTMQEAELLESVGLTYSPDLVLVCLVPNDDQLPSFIHRKNGGLLEASVFLRLLEHVRTDFDGADRKDLADPANVPPEYASMVGPEAVRQGLWRMSYLARRHKFRLAVFCFRGFQPLAAQARGWCRELGIEFLDLEEFMKREGLEYGPALQISAQDVHPNAAFHEQIGRFLLENLKLQAP